MRRLRNPSYPMTLFVITPLADRLYVTRGINVIKSFADRESEKVYHRQRSKKLPDVIQHRARRKLLMIKRARDVNDLRNPPGNRLELLKGDRAGQYSIRINQQWRICFRWDNGDAFDVEITDYH